jgi:hypothetical protein
MAKKCLSIASIASFGLNRRLSMLDSAMILDIFLRKTAYIAAILPTAPSVLDF